MTNKRQELDSPPPAHVAGGRPPTRRRGHRAVVALGWATAVIGLGALTAANNGADDIARELHDLGAPAPFQEDKAEVTQTGSWDCFDYCTGASIFYPAPGPLSEHQALRAVGEHLADTGYLACPPALSE